MLKLESEITNTDSDMKQLNERIAVGFRAVVDLEGLSHRLFQKYNSFIQTQVNIATKEKPALVSKSLCKREQMLCLLDESEIRATEPLTMLEESSAFLNQSNLEDMIRTHNSVALSETSLPDQQSVQAQYRNYDEETGKARNTLYHLVAETKSLYLLSFKEGAFVGHQLT